jgi:hypothetical protein
VVVFPLFFVHEANHVIVYHALLKLIINSLVDRLEHFQRGTSHPWTQIYPLPLSVGWRQSGLIFFNWWIWLLKNLDTWFLFSPLKLQLLHFLVAERFGFLNFADVLLVVEWHFRNFFDDPGGKFASDDVPTLVQQIMPSRN